MATLMTLEKICHQFWKRKFCHLNDAKYFLSFLVFLVKWPNWKQQNQIIISQEQRMFNPNDRHHHHHQWPTLYRLWIFLIKNIHSFIHHHFRFNIENDVWTKKKTFPNQTIITHTHKWNVCLQFFWQNQSINWSIDWPTLSIHFISFLLKHFSVCRWIGKNELEYSNQIN